MSPALAILLALLAIEGVLWIIWPARFRVIIAETPTVMLRIVGVIEIILVVIVVLLA